MVRKSNAETLKDLPATGFIRLPQVLSVIPISRALLWQMVKDGRFVKPVKLSTRTTAWEVGAVRLWIKAHAMAKK